MASDSADWQLELGGEVIARMAGNDTDFPWTYSKLISASRFDRFRSYFSDNETWPETPEFDGLLIEIRSKGGFALRNLRTCELFVSIHLHHAGDTVWFRHVAELKVTQTFISEAAAVILLQCPGRTKGDANLYF